MQHISVSFEMMAYSEEAGGSTNILNILIGYSIMSYNRVFYFVLNSYNGVYFAWYKRIIIV